MAINIPKLILSIGICLGVGVLGSIFTISSIPTWYAALNKPFFSPPNWVFGPVWTILYILMGISLYLVLSGKRQGESKKAVEIFAVQLVLNVIWSIIFFGMKNPLLAFVEIIILWLAIFLTIKSFYKINENSHTKVWSFLASRNKLAGNLLIPYLLWVSFATPLNLSIVLLNP